MGVSFWQVAILVVLFGVPVAMYFVISGGPKDDIRKPLTFFHWSFWVSVAAVVLLVVVALVADDPDAPAPILLALFIVLSVAGWSYLIALGILASRTGRSWILWAGITFLTSPFGTIVSYIAMSTRTKSLAGKT